MVVRIDPLNESRHIKKFSCETWASGKINLSCGQGSGTGLIIIHDSELLEAGVPEPMKSCRLFNPEACSRSLAVHIILSTSRPSYGVSINVGHPLFEYGS
jgi:hypothetical protein